MSRLILSIANLGKYLGVVEFDEFRRPANSKQVSRVGQILVMDDPLSSDTLILVWHVSRSMGDAILLGHYFTWVHGHVTSRRSKDDYVIHEKWLVQLIFRLQHSRLASKSSQYFVGIKKLESRENLFG